MVAIMGMIVENTYSAGEYIVLQHLRTPDEHDGVNIKSDAGCRDLGHV
jgi:hypothetical protein